MPELTIGQLARHVGLRPSAIRYYEATGVLPPAERQRGQRRYDADAVRRVQLLCAGTRAGLSLDEVGALLRDADAGRAPGDTLRALATRRLPELDALIARAQTQRNWLRAALSCGCPTLQACALFAPTGAEPGP